MDVWFEEFDFSGDEWHWISSQKVSYSDQLESRPTPYAPDPPSALPNVEVLQNGCVVVDFSPLKSAGR